MTLEEKVELINEVVFVNIHQMNNTLQKDDMITFINRDNELVEELGLIADKKLTDGKNVEEYITEASVETQVRVNDFF